MRESKECTDCYNNFITHSMNAVLRTTQLVPANSINIDIELDHNLILSNGPGNSSTLFEESRFKESKMVLKLPHPKDCSCDVFIQDWHRLLYGCAAQVVDSTSVFIAMTITISLLSGCSNESATPQPRSGSIDARGLPKMHLKVRQDLIPRLTGWHHLSVCPADRELNSRIATTKNLTTFPFGSRSAEASG